MFQFSDNVVALCDVDWKRASVPFKRFPKARKFKDYRRMLDEKKAGTEETRAYVKDKLRSALWLLKSVDQRQRTIYKVASSIVKFQREFLDFGIERLRPLVLKDVDALQRIVEGG